VHDDAASHVPGRPRAAWRQRAVELGDRFEASGRRPEPERERPTRGDWALTATLAVAPAISFALAPNVGQGRWYAPVWVGALLLVPQLLPLAWRRVAPNRVMSIVGTVTGLYFLLGFTFTFNIVGVLVALYAEAAYGERRSSGLTSLAISLVIILRLASLDPSNVSRENFPLFAFNVFVFVTAWATGDAARSRRLLTDELHARATEAERSRAVEAERAVLGERTRIARELHDLIAHTVSVMVVQAGAGRRMGEVDPTRARAVLGDIEATGRSALTELRRLVDVLRAGDAAAELAPQPGLEAVEALVATLADAGVPVRLRWEGRRRPLPSSVDVCAYRIVQEALTNVLRHAGNVREVDVRIRSAATHVEVEVSDDGRGAAAGAGDGPRTEGSGLIGMRERVALFGGSVDTGPRPGGGYRVRAELPLGATRGDAADHALHPTGA
jgi:signal transduction histidine kinase